jgi:hypothetical protein
MSETLNRLDTSAGGTDQEHQGKSQKKNGIRPARTLKYRWIDAVTRDVRKLLGTAG